MDELSKHKDGLERERDRLINEVTQLTTKLSNALGYQNELERKTSAADLKINEIAALLEVSIKNHNRISWKCFLLGNLYTNFKLAKRKELLRYLGIMLRHR